MLFNQFKYMYRCVLKCDLCFYKYRSTTTAEAENNMVNHNETSEGDIISNFWHQK